MWMVDMRGDGQTQYDGFEYNWFFRSKYWRAQTGFMNAGGWVRRRRWVRLMMRPAIATKVTRENVSGASSSIVEGLPAVETGATRPPSVVLTPADDNETSDIDSTVWQGSVEEDWRRCRQTLMRLERDGRKLELWSRWLQDLLSSNDPDASDRVPKRQWTEDEHLLPSQHTYASTGTVDETLVRDAGVHLEAAKQEHVTKVLQKHVCFSFRYSFFFRTLMHTGLQGSEILGLFVYPDSRTHFVELISQAGLLPDLTDGLGPSGISTSILDFWSSSQSVLRLLP
jgi:hypothetical protein